MLCHATMPSTQLLLRIIVVLRCMTSHWQGIASTGTLLGGTGRLIVVVLVDQLMFKLFSLVYCSSIQAASAATVHPTDLHKFLKGLYSAGSSSTTGTCGFIPNLVRDAWVGLNDERTNDDAGCWGSKLINDARFTVVSSYGIMLIILQPSLTLALALVPSVATGEGDRLVVWSYNTVRNVLVSGQDNGDSEARSVVLVMLSPST